MAVANSTLDLAADPNWPDGFNLVQGAGTAYEIGKQHGADQAVQIRTIMERYASMLGPRLQNIPELEEALAKPTLYFCDDDLEEIHGIADGAGLPLPAVIAHNLGMYPDYVPGCTQFAVTARRNSDIGLVHAVNEDSPLSLTLPDCLSRVVQVRVPRGRIPHVTFSVSGQAGGLNGMNAMGIAVSSTLLLDRPRRAGSTTGKVHPVIVKRILERASTIEDAIEIVRHLDRVGAWSLCISHYPTDRLCYLEYDGKNLAVQENPPFVLTTNHCLLQPPVADVPEHSRHRLARLHQLLGEQADGRWTLERSQKALRDQFDLGRGRQTTHATMNTVRRVDNQISVVMLPATGELWVTPGPRAGVRQDEFFRFNVRELFQQIATADQSGELAPERIVLNSASLREGLPAENQYAVQRHVMRVSAVALPAGSPEMPTLHGSVLILGESKVGEAMKARLQAAGATVHQLPIGADIDATLAELNRLWAIAPAPHLFLTTAREDAANVTETEWSGRAVRGMQVPYFVCQRWVQLVQEAGLTKQATLVGLTALGGDFGFSGRIAGVEGGGLAGLFKGIRREFSGLTVKVIDAPAEESPAQLAACVLKELAAATPQTEVGYLRGERLLPKAIPQTASTQRPASKIPHGTWIVTGGARGVTAVVARELGKRFGLSMHLLGSTSLPSIDPTWRNLTEEGLKSLKRTISEQARAAGKNPAQAWKDIERAIEIDRTLQAFRADGVEAVYHACDVSDRASLTETLDRIRKADGGIHGIIHGAGVEAACKFEKKKRENVLATLGVKVDAAMMLLELTKFDQLGWFIGFGSTSGRFGGLGQTDYSMASDLLCKICDCVRANRPDVAAVGFHWPPWSDVGMASRPESKIALQSSGLAFMPPMEGVAHVIDELSTMMLEGEILCIDKPDMLDLDGTMGTAAEADAYRLRETAIRSAALIDGIHDLQANQQLTALARFNPVVEPFLLEHRHQGVPILPAVGGMETMAEAANILTAGGKKIVGLKNMTVHQGFRFHTLRSQTAQVRATQTEDGVRCELRADFCDRNGRLVEPHRLQMDATIELSDNYSPLPHPNLGPIPTTWTAHKYADDWQTMKFPEDGRVYHGYPFRGLKEYALVDGGMWGKINVPLVSDIAGDRNADGWLLPSATIDAGLLGCDLMLWTLYRSARLPQGFDRIRISRPLKDGEPLMFRVWLRATSGPVVPADFVMVDANGHVVIQVDGFRMVEVKSGTSGKAEIPAGAPSPVAANLTERPFAPQIPSSPRTVSADDLAALPLIDQALWVTATELSADLQFDPTKDLFLLQHKMTGRPILPAVIGMESMIEAASLALPGKCLGAVREFVIKTGMKFRTDAPQAARVQVCLENGQARCQLVGGENFATVYQSALIEMTDQPATATIPAPGQPPFPYNPMMYPDDGQLFHGPMFRALKQLFLHRDGGWAVLSGYPINNLAGERRGDRWFLPPAVLDSCLVACGVDMFIQLEKRVEVPYGCEEFKLVRLPKPKEQCVLRLKYRGHDARHTTYDFTLFGADGGVILTAKSYRGIVTGREGDSSHWDGKAAVSL